MFSLKRENPARAPGGGWGWVEAKEPGGSCRPGVGLLGRGGEALLLVGLGLLGLEVGGLGRVAGEEGGQLVGLSRIGLGLRRGIDVDQPQNLGKPTRVGEHALGFAGHIRLLQMLHQLGPLVPLGFAHGFKDS